MAAILRTRSAPLASVTVLLLASVACSDTDSGSASGGGGGGGRGDGADARAAHPPASARCPIVTRGGACRAAGPTEVVTIASGGFLLPAAGFPAADGGYLTFGVRWNEARILSARSDRDWGFHGADALPFPATGATGATARGHDFLFFMAGDLHGSVALRVAAVEGGALRPAQHVTIEGPGFVPSWPQAVGLADGRVLLAFVAPQLAVYAGVDDRTATRFRMKHIAVSEPDLLGVLAHVGTTARGAWVLTYQVADASWRFRSHVLLSSDEGGSWKESEARALADRGQVSGAFPIARADEGADIYYVKGSVTWRLDNGNRTERETICRRHLHEDGTLGPEQQVTSDEVGTVANPQPRRLPDGRIALMFAYEHSAKEKDLRLVILDGDAP